MSETGKITASHEAPNVQSYKLTTFHSPRHYFSSVTKHCSLSFYWFFSQVFFKPSVDTCRNCAKVTTTCAKCVKQNILHTSHIWFQDLPLCNKDWDMHFPFSLALSAKRCPKVHCFAVVCNNRVHMMQSAIGQCACLLPAALSTTANVTNVHTSKHSQAASYTDMVLIRVCI